jgi:hypothetical protein
LREVVIEGNGLTEAETDTAVELGLLRLRKAGEHKIIYAQTDLWRNIGASEAYDRIQRRLEWKASPRP